MNNSLEHEIEKYKELLEKEMITQEEFEAIKEQIIKNTKLRKIII